MNMKKILGTVTALALSTSLIVSGCGKKEDTKAPSESELPEGIAAVVGDFEVGQDEFDLYLTDMISAVQYEIGDNAGWENQIYEDGMTAGEYIINSVKDTIHTYYVFRSKAKELGIYSEADQKAFISERIAEAYGGEEAYENDIAALGYSKDAFENFLASMGAYYALLDSYCTEEEAEEIFTKEYLSAKHILFLFDSEGGDEAATLAKANAAYERAIGGESFEDLIVELNEDPGEDPATGYIFTEGEMVDEFYQGTLALEIGEISKPVMTNFGYHVIKRYPLPEKGTESFDTYLQSIKYQQSGSTIDASLDDWKKEYPMTVSSSVFGSIDFSKYVSNVNTADGSVFND